MYEKNIGVRKPRVSNLAVPFTNTNLTSPKKKNVSTLLTVR